MTVTFYMPADTGGDGIRARPPCLSLYPCRASACCLAALRCIVALARLHSMQSFGGGPRACAEPASDAADEFQNRPPAARLPVHAVLSGFLLLTRPTNPALPDKVVNGMGTYIAGAMVGAPAVRLHLDPRQPPARRMDPAAAARLRVCCPTPSGRAPRP